MKNNLLKKFIEDLNLKDFDLCNFKIPPVGNVNRSLTISEYEIIRVLNIVQPKINLADALVNYAPDVKPEKLLYLNLHMIKLLKKF